MPLLRLPGAGPGGLPGAAALPASAIAGLGTQRLEAEVRARFPDVALPADGHRHDAGATAATSGRLAAFRSGKVRSCWARR